MFRDVPITCLFSHKCGFGVCDVPNRCVAGSACFSCQLREGLKTHGIDLLVDPMRPGDHLQIRMETFDFDALVFLISEESLESKPCATELETSRLRGRPLFTVLMSGQLPDQYRDRLCVSITEAVTPDGISRIANAIREHVVTQRLLIQSKSAPPDVRRAAARRLCSCDSSVLAEYVRDLESAYMHDDDDSTCFWLASAIGHTRGRDAVGILESFLNRETRPYPREGLNRALASVKEVVSGVQYAKSTK